MSKKILITENQLKTLVTSISEEAAGYDDFYQMLQHGGKSMDILSDNLKDLAIVFRGIVQIMKSENINYINLKENLKEAIDLINTINQITNIVFKDFTDKDVIESGKKLSRKLESYQDKVRMLINMGKELLSKETLLDKLDSLTQVVLRDVNEYAYKLKDSEMTFRKRLEKGRDKRNPDYN
jgi:hypothetical protein